MNTKENFDINFLTSLNQYKNASDDDKFNYFEANLLQSLNTFNDEYYNYINQCFIDQNTGKRVPGSTVPTNNIAPNLTCDDLKSILKDDANIITQYINDNGSDLIKNIKGYDISGIDSSYNKILTNHKEIIKTRTDLDMKLKELYDIKGSRYEDNFNSLDSTIYLGVLVTVISSVILFYTFKNL